MESHLVALIYGILKVDGYGPLGRIILRVIVLRYGSASHGISQRGLRDGETPISIDEALGFALPS